ncbi:MAG TPA: hypothetical protein VKP65_17960 [Rhodothermales bacterium]|nr:hypothetical protein [Rhodothermales bacterium]
MFFPAALYAQEHNADETVHIDVYTPEGAPASPAKETAICPGDVPVGTQALTIDLEVTTTSPNPVQYTATFSFSNETLDATVTSDTHGDPTPVVNGSTTTYTVEGALSNTMPFRVNVVTTATAVGPAMTDWQVRRTGAITQQETCEFEVVEGGGGPEADLALVVSGIQGSLSFDVDTKTATLPLGEVVTICIDVVNNGPDEATEVVITGGLDPAIFEMQDVSLDPPLGACSFDPQGGFFSCAGLTLPVGDSVKVSVTGPSVTETDETGFSASTGHPNDPDFSNNDDAVSITVAEVTLSTDLGVLKRARSPATGEEVDPGGTLLVAKDDTLIYTISVANTSTFGGGPHDSPNTAVLDQLPDDVEFVSVTTSRGTCQYDAPTRLVTCELGTLAAGEQLLDVIEITVIARGTSGTTIDNTAAVAGGLPDPEAANDESTVTARVMEADLAITKEASTGTPGFNVVYFYTLTVTNTGPEDAPNTVVRDTLNARLGFVSATSTQGSCSFSTTDRVLTCDLGTVLASDTVQIQLAVRSDRQGVGLSNTATVESALPESDRTNNTDDELVLIQPLGDGTEITKEISSDRAVVGDTLSYTLRFDLPKDKYVVLTDTLSEKVMFAEAVLDRFADCQVSHADRVVTITCRGDRFDRSGTEFIIKVVAVRPGLCPNIATVEEFLVTDMDTTLLTMDTDTAMVAISESTPTEPEADLPETFLLYENYPNPFNPETTIRFDVPFRTRLRLEVFDVRGRVVAILVNDELAAGAYKAIFNGRGLPSGSYFSRLTAGSFRSTQAMMLLK